jgi:hypothetical protein
MEEIKTNNTQTVENIISSKGDLENTIFWIFAGITVSAVFLNAYYIIFVGNHDSFISTVATVSNFTDSVVALFLATKMLALNASFYKTIGVSVFFVVMGLLMEGLGLSILFFSIGIFITIGMFMLIMKIYDTSFIKTLLLLIIQFVIIVLINLSVQLVALILNFLPH